MANALDWLQSGNANKIKQKDFDKYFLKYGDTSPLQNVLTPAQKNAISNFNANRRSPGMAEEADPSITPTYLSNKLEPMPVGRGSWFNRPQEPASLQTYLRRMELQDVQQAQEQARVKKLILSTPEFVGYDPSAWTEKGLLEQLKIIRSKKPINPLDEKNKQLTIKNKEATLEKKKAELEVTKSLLPSGGTTPATKSNLSPKDLQALEWAKKNPGSPYASGIILKLKQKGM